jgi:MinD-like ATPase involved in chromosome partitioning or flagellar assembly
MANPFIVATHSYRGGTGKSNTTANLAVELSKLSLRVGVVDTDLPSPGVHILFGQDEPAVTINGVLNHAYEVAEAFIDVTPQGLPGGGKVFLMAGSPKPGDIARIVKEGYSMDQMVEIYKGFIKHASLDVLLLDTHPGINETTLFSITVADLLLMILRPDRQDYQGTAVTVDVARKLGVPDLKILVNKALTSLDWAQLRQTIETTYSAPCIGVLPQTDDIMRYGGSGLFTVQEPNHPLSLTLRDVAAQINALRS